MRDLRQTVLRFTVPSVLVAILLFGRLAQAEISIVQTDNWELFTNGRVNAFLSSGWGDGYPVARDGEKILDGGGLDAMQENIDKVGADGKPVQGPSRPLEFGAA